MATQISMPKLGLSMKEGTVARWLKQEGDSVKKGEPIVEVMTDKITNKVEAPAEGLLLKVVAEKKVKLPVGGLLGIIGAAGEDISAALAAALVKPDLGGGAVAASATKVASVAVTGKDGDRIKISPVARKLAQDNGIDYLQLVGTGPEGRITKEDVEAAIAAASLVAVDERAVAQVIPYDGMRRVIGENMASSWMVAPKVTNQVSVDVSALLTLRETINSDRKESEKVSITDLMVKAVARALLVKPRINATLSGEVIKVLRDINIGVAVALDEGLVVPVVRHADQKSLYEISKEIRDLAKRARRNKLTVDEMSGGSFTVTNLGAYGSVDFFTPIINQPESAILGMGRTVKTPVVFNDQIAIRSLMGLSFAFDHRVIDGAPAAEFMAVLIKYIEQPHNIFI